MDEAGQDPSFLRFRTRVLNAAMRRDVAFITSVLHAEPYVYARWPGHDDVQSWEHFAVIDALVQVRERPDFRAPVIDVLSYDIVQAVGSPEERFTPIVTPKGARGYVPSANLWSPRSHRAGFIKLSEGWRLIAFVAGD